jgi:Ca2+/Na+ antiporter
MDGSMIFILCVTAGLAGFVVYLSHHSRKDREHDDIHRKGV